ncbi:MAG: hypothetical protein KGL39_16550 [Patescibacteria group bacterium]|nr:hypothetical protein [Patescibacteria group bacterium]
MFGYKTSEVEVLLVPAAERDALAAQLATFRAWAEADCALEGHMAECDQGCDMDGLCEDGELLAAKLSEAGKAALALTPTAAEERVRAPSVMPDLLRRALVWIREAKLLRVGVSGEDPTVSPHPEAMALVQEIDDTLRAFDGKEGEVE